MDLIHQLGIEWPLLITQIIGFLILMWLLNQFAFKRVFGILDQRRAEIQATYDQMDQDRLRMEQARREYEQRLQNIEAEARERIQASVREAQALSDRIREDAQTQAEAILERGRNESERERQKAFLEMRQQLVAIAISAAGKVVGESLDDARHTRLVDDFISNVGAGAVFEAGRGVSHNTIGDGSGNGTGHPRPTDSPNPDQGSV
jgi:F-type H+-transporting ATPase subunit b